MLDRGHRERADQEWQRQLSAQWHLGWLVWLAQNNPKKFPPQDEFLALYDEELAKRVAEQKRNRAEGRRKAAELAAELDAVTEGEADGE